MRGPPEFSKLYLYVIYLVFLQILTGQPLPQVTILRIHPTDTAAAVGAQGHLEASQTVVPLMTLTTKECARRARLQQA